jgi:hypothetical protein
MIVECQICHLPFIWHGEIVAISDDALLSLSRRFSFNRYGLVVEADTPAWLCYCPTPRIKVVADTSSWRGYYGRVLDAADS